MGRTIRLGNGDIAWRPSLCTLLGGMQATPRMPGRKGIHGAYTGRSFATTMYMLAYLCANGQG
jgi:hypothetical protein